MAAKSLGKNVSYTLTGSKLVIEIDISKEFGESKSGKTIIVASTEGNKAIDDVKIGINVYKYPDAKPAKKK